MKITDQQQLQPQFVLRPQCPTLAWTRSDGPAAGDRREQLQTRLDEKVPCKRSAQQYDLVSSAKRFSASQRCSQAPAQMQGGRSPLGMIDEKGIPTVGGVSAGNSVTNKGDE